MTSETGGDPSRRSSTLLDRAEDVVVAAGQIGYSLYAIGLSFLPSRTRQHVHAGVYEFHRAIVNVPRGIAETVGTEINRWIDAGEKGTPARVQHIKVGVESDTSPIAPATRPVVSSAAVAPSTAPRVSPAAPAMSTPAPTTAAPAARPPAPATPAPAAARPPAAPATPAPAPVASKPAAAPTPAEATTGAQLPNPYIISATPDGVTISYIEYDPPGRDLQGEYVLLQNKGNTPVLMGGWTLSDQKATHKFVFPPFTLGPGAEVKIWSRAGNNNAGNLYWGSRNPIWNNDGDSATLKNANGQLIGSYTYTGKKK